MLQKSNVWSSPFLCNYIIQLYCYTVSFVKTFAQHLYNLSDLNFDEKCNCLWSLCDVSFFFLFCLRVSVCAHTRIGMKGVSTASKAVSTYQTLVFWLPPWKKTPLSFLLSSRWVGWTRIHLRGIIMMMLKKNQRIYITQIFDWIKKQTQGSDICFFIRCSVCPHPQGYLLPETMGKARCWLPEILWHWQGNKTNASKNSVMCSDTSTERKRCFCVWLCPGDTVDILNRYWSFLGLQWFFE